MLRDCEVLFWEKISSKGNTDELAVPQSGLRSIFRDDTDGSEGPRFLPLVYNQRFILVLLTICISVLTKIRGKKILVLGKEVAFFFFLLRCLRCVYIIGPGGPDMVL